MNLAKPATLFLAIATLPLTPDLHAQGRGDGGGGGGLPADFQDKIHQLFASPEKIHRTVDITSSGYIARTTTADPELASALQTHVRQMSGRLAAGMPVRRWDPAFTEFFEHYDDIDHKFTDLKNGIQAEVTGQNPEAVAAVHNHAYIILDFSSQGDTQMHQPHRTALDDDGGESQRFRGGPPDARAADLAKTFGASASEACTQLIKTLGSQLKTAMETGGPEAALPLCNAVAIPLTDGVSKNHKGLTVSRVSDRLRNPKNAPDDIDNTVLDHFKKTRSDTRPLAHLTTAPDGKTVRYYQPLIVSDTCLKCHGDRQPMSDELKTLIDKLYPDDKAHGYKLGDIRGLVRVERKAPQQP